MPRGLKVGFIIGASIIGLICASIIIWFLSVCVWGEKKEVSKTFYVGDLTLADGTTQNIIEVEYFSNRDNKGFEAFEIKYTYFMDENKTNTYSQGFQYIAQFETNIEFGILHDDLSVKKTGSGGWLFNPEKYYDCQNSVLPMSNVLTYNYMETNSGYIRSTNPINSKSSFKIEIGEDIYLMKFKNLDTPKDKTTYIGSCWDELHPVSADKYHDLYYVYNEHNFSRLLYQAIKTSALGVNYDIVFEFGNMFNYYKFNKETGKFDTNKTNYDDTLNIEADIKSYYSIKVTTHEEGFTSSSQSMFGSFLGNDNFNLYGDYSNGDYFVGYSIVDVGLGSFSLVTIEDNNVALKLSDEFITYYNKYKDTIKLSIVIDLDLLESLGYTFIGFTADSGLDKFNIYECYTISGGEKVEDFTNSLEVVYV